MESRARFLRHSIHKMVVAFPLGLVTAALFDLVGLWKAHPFWFHAAFWMIAVGVLSGLLAAIFGLIDWLAIPSGTRAKAVGLRHALVNSAVLVLFAISWFLRRGNPEAPGTVAVGISFIGVALSLVGAWLGGELADRLGVGIDDGANLNAPSSLSSTKAGEVPRTDKGPARKIA
jgi:uncharacterized membrane protein